MANAPWRCSECGTINEPVANACRTCGRWPSLFDLQESVVEEDVEPEQVEPERFPQTQVEVEEPPPFETQTFEPKTFDLDIGSSSEPVTEDRKRRRWIDVDVRVEPEEIDPETDTEESHRGRRWASFLVPIAFLVYLAISIIFGDR